MTAAECAAWAAMMVLSCALTWIAEHFHAREQARRSLMNE